MLRRLSFAICSPLFAAAFLVAIPLGFPSEAGYWIFTGHGHDEYGPWLPVMAVVNFAEWWIGHE